MSQHWRRSGAGFGLLRTSDGSKLWRCNSCPCVVPPSICGYTNIFATTVFSVTIPHGMYENNVACDFCPKLVGEFLLTKNNSCTWTYSANFCEEGGCFQSGITITFGMGSQYLGPFLRLRVSRSSADGSGCSSFYRGSLEALYLIPGAQVPGPALPNPLVLDRLSFNSLPGNGPCKFSGNTPPLNMTVVKK